MYSNGKDCLYLFLVEFSTKRNDLFSTGGLRVRILSSFIFKQYLLLWEKHFFFSSNRILSSGTLKWYLVLWESPFFDRQNGRVENELWQWARVYLPELKRALFCLRNLLCWSWYLDITIRPRLGYRRETFNSWDHSKTTPRLIVWKLKSTMIYTNQDTVQEDQEWIEVVIMDNQDSI